MMPTAMPRDDRRPTRIAGRSLATLAATLAATLLLTATAGAQSTRSTSPAPAAPAASPAAAFGGVPNLQGIWDFTMRIGSRTSTGFFALGPIEKGWAGSLTPDSTNTLAIRILTVKADSFHMVVASPEGDVPFYGRLSADARSMEGTVQYHGGGLYPMTATRRIRRP